MAFERSPEGMQLPAGSVHVFRAACVVKSKKLDAEPLGMIRLNSRFRAGQEKPLDAFMPEAPNHGV